MRVRESTHTPARAHTHTHIHKRTCVSEWRGR